MTIRKPELIGATRGEISIHGEYEDHPSPCSFISSQSGDQKSVYVSHEGPSQCYDSRPDFDTLVLMLGHEKEDKRIAAAEALGILGDPKAIEPLFRTCMDESSSVKEAARNALAVIISRLHH